MNQALIFIGAFAATVSLGLVGLVIVDAVIHAAKAARDERHARRRWNEILGARASFDRHLEREQATVIVCERLFALPAYRERND